MIIHHFEALLSQRPSPLASNISPPAPITSIASPTLTTVPSTSASQETPEQRERNKKKSSAARRRHDRYVLQEAEQWRKRKQQEEEEMYKNTLDVQLGPPSASSSVYSAYEDGRIGIVTVSFQTICFPLP